VPKVVASRHIGRSLGLFAVVSMVAAACSAHLSLSSHDGSATSVRDSSILPPIHPPTLETTTTINGGLLPSCEADQLRIGFRGTQGSTGNYFAAFWIANSSDAPCSLRSEVNVELLNAQGSEQLAASGPISTPIGISASGSIPATEDDPAQGQELADVTLRWPTVFDSGYSTPAGSGECSEPLVTPIAVRFTFSGDQSVVVTDLQSNSFGAKGFGTICGPTLAINSVQAL
jgi:hypothetical protein